MVPSKDGITFTKLRLSLVLQEVHLLLYKKNIFLIMYKLIIFYSDPAPEEQVLHVISHYEQI
jgi:hypothetical protein